MLNYFGTLVIRCRTHHYKTRLYVNLITGREFRVRTLCQMEF